ncbi:MAG: hypothetical protein HRT51_19560 [Colwellia sp.]|nr:hypothetical protein [Colwellia sp.]
MGYVFEVKPSCGKCSSIHINLKGTRLQTLQCLLLNGWDNQVVSRICANCLVEQINIEKLDLSKTPEYYQGGGSVFDINNGETIYSFDGGEILIGKDTCLDELSWCCWIHFDLGYVAEVPRCKSYYLEKWLEKTGLGLETFLAIVSEFDIWGIADNEAGYAAFNRGCSLDENPYSEEEEEKYWGWHSGWMDAKRGLSNSFDFTTGQFKPVEN